MTNAEFCRMVITLERLVAQHVKLLELAKQYASECGECGGTGKDVRVNGEVDECAECAPIRDVIRMAEGK